ncbi:MAG: FAD-dependent oxidoreductase [Planctomycetota bacterium]|nr:FAD-dependent oxidoreductase [Planctomycetota bacterium]
MGAADTEVLVIGGGVQGVGVAQAAAAAGHRVLCLERTRIAAGTSSRSSKLIHGGLRYLESFQLRLVRESLRERQILLRIAPHLVELVPFFIPVYHDTSRGPWTLRAGLSLYALLGGLRQDARFQVVPRPAWPSLDGLNLEGLRTVFRYHDGQTDDAALCRAVAASAAELGAVVLEGAEVVGANHDADGWRVRYRIDAEVRELVARVVVNATGPWANRLLDRVTPSPARREVELVGGTHLELSGRLGQGIYYAEAPQDQRAVFFMPWKGHVLVGTTEAPYEGDPAAVAPTAEEVTYLREVTRHFFPGLDNGPLDAWSGLRVLPKAEGRAFHRTREVLLAEDRATKPTFITLYGGKLTGYRATAARVMRRLAPSLPAAERKADTATLTLPADPG